MLFNRSVRLFKLYRRCNNFNYTWRTFKHASVEDVPEVSPTSIKRTLKSLNVLYDEGYTCFTTKCPMCNSKTASNSTLYVNKITGLFMCTKCKHNGDWDYLETCINTKKTKKHKTTITEDISSKITEVIDEIQKTTKHISSLPKATLNSVLEALNIPHYDNIFDNLNVRIDDNSKLYFPLLNADNETVGFKIFGKDTSEKPQTKCGGLIKGSSGKFNDELAILVENIPDFLTLLNSNLKATIVCLPNGIKSLPQYYLPTLEMYKKIVLWLGTDVQSLNAAKKFGKKLGEKRCYCISASSSRDLRLPHKDPTQNFESIISSAQNLWHKSITTFATLRQDVFTDLQNIDQVQGVKWKRFPTLNKILKGHRNGELTVITGPTGSGKTTFISEYSLDLAMQGVNTLWGSFEIRNARLARTMLQQMVGVPLEKNLHNFDDWADKFERLPIYYMTFHGQQSIKVVMDAVDHASYVHDINHVIIDNVQFMMGMNEEHKHIDRFWKQDAIVAAFRTFATRKNCHVTLVIHPRKERTDEELTTNSIFGGAKASQEADNVLLIQDKRLTGPRGKKYLQIAKNRYSGDLGVMPLDFDKDSLSYGLKKKKSHEEIQADERTN